MTDILIVEDDKELSSLLTDFLRAEGYTVSAVESGERAVQLFDRYGARLVVLDINLPDGSGLDYLHELREKHCSAPIIMLTANDMETDVVIGLESGADDYYYKAFFTCNPSCARECTASPRAKSRFFDLSAGAFSV